LFEAALVEGKMKKLIFLVLLLLTIAFCFSACVDIDEALPHYGMQSSGQ